MKNLGLLRALLMGAFGAERKRFFGACRYMGADKASGFMARVLLFSGKWICRSLTGRRPIVVVPMTVIGRLMAGDGNNSNSAGGQSFRGRLVAKKTLSRSGASGLLILCAGLAMTTNSESSEVQATLIQRGEYLARAGDCISCHTANGGSPLAGGGRLDTPFGFMFAPNITPDPATGIGQWSSDDFYRALHFGLNRAGEDMYPTMPYDFYTRVTREDSDAIYAYLFSLSPVHNQVDVNHLHFPFDERWTMGGWRELYFTEGSFTPSHDKSTEWNRGAYLVEGLGHCSACHSPRNVLGAIDKNKTFEGAVVDGWFALDLSENIITGLGSWSVDNIATYLRTGEFKGKTAAIGPMAEVIHNSLQYLTDSDLHAIADYLKALPADSSLRTGRRRPDPTRLQGANLYINHCVGCHQAMGRGVPGVFPPLAGNGVVLATDPADIVKVVLIGVPAQGGHVAMPSFAEKMSDQQIAEIANYVRTSWGNTASPDVTGSAVEYIRIRAQSFAPK